jgi:clostripain
MVYISADDGTLERTSINDFIEMANISSNKDINIVVQLDRVPGDDDTYDDWTDCRRFLITPGLTPNNGSEVMNIGEVNMGDPATLVSFVEWAAYNYPAEKYALVISSHGKGWEGCCWDETSGNDNMDLTEMRSALSDISGFIGQPLDIIGFDACLMGTTEVAYELHDYATVMVASEHAEPSSGWPYDAILARLVETPEVDAAQLAAIIVDDYYTSHAPTGYTMAAVDLTKIDAVVVSLGDLAQALAIYDGTDTEAIKEYASSVMTALDEAVICESHGTRWYGSHGLAIYFPKAQEEFDSAYNAGTVSLADNTVWEEFLTGYFTYADGDWITAARSQTRQYYGLETVDLYDFCQKLINSEI